jgi:hypothetical protein
MNSNPISYLVREWNQPVQEIALMEAPLVEDERGRGSFSPQVLHLRWHLDDDETTWEWAEASIEGPLSKAAKSAFCTVTKGTRHYGAGYPKWLHSVVDAHWPGSEEGRA